MRLKPRLADRIRQRIPGERGKYRDFAEANNISRSYLAQILSGHAAVSVAQFNRLFESLGFKLIQPEPTLEESKQAEEVERYE